MNNCIIYDEIQYKRAFKELLVILNYIPKTDFEKIPKDIIETLKYNADNDYHFELDLDRSMEEQRISDLTKAIIENFYRDYWVTNIEKKKILEEEKIKRQEAEEEKEKRFNSDDIFKNKTNQEKQQADKNLPTEIKKKKFFSGLYETFKKIFFK